MTTNDKYLSIYCDGGSRGNPGPAASAFVAYDSTGRVVHRQGFYLGVATNNQAEYQAVIEALKFLIARLPAPGTKLNFYLDSQLVVNQIIGVYKIKDQILKVRKLEIVKLIENCKLKIVNFSYLPREQNKQADLLVNQTLDRNLG